MADLLTSRPQHPAERGARRPGALVRLVLDAPSLLVYAVKLPIVAIVHLLAALAGQHGRTAQWRLDVGARVAVRRLPARDRVSWAATLADAVLSVPIGLLGWLVVLLLVPNTVRNVFLYGFIGDGDYRTSWGGPTLAGAWAVHATLAIGMVPGLLVVLRGLASISVRLDQHLLGGRHRSTAVPVAVLVGAAGLVFAVALVNQAT